MTLSRDFIRLLWTIFFSDIVQNFQGLLLFGKQLLSKNKFINLFNLLDLQIIDDI